jgi:hypothetical protein
VSLYWHPNYWHANYWHANYWGGVEPSVPVGSYWATGYWHPNYWHTNYWAATAGSGNSLGSINVTLEDFSGAFTGIQSEIFDITVTVGPTWSATEFGAYNGTIGVTLEDGTSVVLGTFTASGAILGTIASTLGDASPAITGSHVAPASRSGTISSTLQNATAIFNAQLPQDIDGSIGPTLEDDTAAFRGNFYDAGVAVATFYGLFEDTTGLWLGESAAPIAFIDTGPVNTEAIEIPSSYEICDRTGFRVMPGTLRKQWDGLLVRAESYDARHPQDFVRGRAEHPKGSKRPEQADVFITEQVTADDL